MTLEDLKKFDLIYLATVYTSYPDGIEAAHIAACTIAARLIEQKINIYSPIAHTHPIAIHGDLDPLDHGYWMDFDAAIIRKSDALLIAQMREWERSKGIALEVTAFLEQGKPIFYLDPADLAVTHTPALRAARELGAA